MKKNILVGGGVKGILTKINIKQKYKNIISRLEALEKENKSLEEKCRRLEGRNRAYDNRLVFLEKKANRTVPKKYLTNFDVHLAEHCNLNCQCCIHCSPLADEEYLPFDIFEKDFLRMHELTQGHIDKINLMGGEPLLNKEIAWYMKKAREIFPLPTVIRVVSNGILLDKMGEDFWSVCRDYEITVSVTKYPINLDYAQLEKKSASYGRKLEYFGNEPVLKHSWHFPLDLSGSQDAVENFKNCREGNTCIFLRNGKLFTCVVPPNVHHFNKYFGENVPVTDKDCIDIHKANSIEEILEFLAKPIPFCSYCYVNRRSEDLDWKISERDIKEWT